MRRCLLFLVVLLAAGLIFLAGLVTGLGGLQKLTDIKIFDPQGNAAKWLLDSAGSLGEGKPSGVQAGSLGAGKPSGPQVAPGGAAAVQVAPGGAAAVQAAASPAPSPPSDAAAGGAVADRKTRAKYGFYMHVFNDPAAVIHQVRQLSKHFPDSPVYIMSDGGTDYSGLCEEEGCQFKLCPPANDRWHPWPFCRRIYDAAVALNAEYVIMLEPDNTVHGPIKRPPTHDAGGLYVTARKFSRADYVERLAQERKPGFQWTKLSMQAGLAGGAYFRTEAILDAFSDEAMSRIDWNFLGEKCSKEIYSSDFAMQYALAARGWSVHPWEETAQMDRKKDEPLTGPKDAAFRHYCSCYPGGKPTYNLRLKPEDQRLIKPPPEKYRKSNMVCQLCYNLSRYTALWGSADCTNRQPFRYSDLLMERHHPELKTKCELEWLCEPRRR